MKIKLSVIVPFYNEAATIQKVIAQVLNQKEVFEIICVNDGSTDNSAQKVTKIKNKKIKLINHAQNRGKGAAIITGIKKARGTHLIIQDADLELSPSDYPNLLSPIKTKQAQFVIGNRWENKPKFTVSRLGNLYLSSLASLLLGQKISDPYCCYKVGSTELWKSLHLSSPSFEIEAEIIAKVIQKKVSVIQVPIKYTPRTYHQGKKIKATDALTGSLTLLKYSRE